MLEIIYIDIAAARWNLLIQNGDKVLDFYRVECRGNDDKGVGALIRDDAYLTQGRTCFVRLGLCRSPSSGSPGGRCPP